MGIKKKKIYVFRFCLQKLLQTETKNTTEIKKCEFNTRLYKLFLDLKKQNGGNKTIQFSME